MKSIKQKLMLLGLAGATFLSAPSVMADPFDDTKDESVEDTEKKDETSPFGDTNNADASSDSPASSKPAKKESFLSSKKGSLILLGGGVVLYVVMKVVEKKKKDNED